MDDARCDSPWHGVRHLPFRWHVVDDAAAGVAADLADRRALVLACTASAPLGLEFRWREQLRERLIGWIGVPAGLTWRDAIDRTACDVRSLVADVGPAIWIVIGNVPALAMAAAVRATVRRMAAERDPGTPPGTARDPAIELWLAPRHDDGAVERADAGPPHRATASEREPGSVAATCWPDAAFLDDAWMRQGCRSAWRARADRALALAEQTQQVLPSSSHAHELACKAARRLAVWRNTADWDTCDRLSRAELALAIWTAGLASADAIWRSHAIRPLADTSPSETQRAATSPSLNRVDERPTAPALP